MNSDDLGQLIYLVLLLLAVGSWVFVRNRQTLGKTAQQLLIWVLIFLGVIAAYGLWDDIRATVMPQQAVLSEEGARAGSSRPISRGAHPLRHD